MKLHNPIEVIEYADSAFHGASIILSIIVLGAAVTYGVQQLFGFSGVAVMLVGASASRVLYAIFKGK